MRVSIAHRLAEAHGYQGRVSYTLADAEDWLFKHRQEKDVDLIFFHASLHHIETPATVLRLCAEILRRGNPGLLYVDEYIGPSRDEWTPGHLGYAAALFEQVPLEYRQSSNLAPPVAFEDPTEMIRSSSIYEAFLSSFDALEYRPYFGNVVMPLISGIRPHGLHHPDVRHLIREGMNLEDYLAHRQVIDPMYAVFVARPL